MTVSMVTMVIHQQVSTRTWAGFSLSSCHIASIGYPGSIPGALEAAAFRLQCLGKGMACWSPR